MIFFAGSTRTSRRYWLSPSINASRRSTVPFSQVQASLIHSFGQQSKRSTAYQVCPPGFRARAFQERCDFRSARCWSSRRTRSTPTCRFPNWDSQHAMPSSHCSPRSLVSRTPAFPATSRWDQCCARQATISASVKSWSSWQSACLRVWVSGVPISRLSVMNGLSYNEVNRKRTTCCERYGNSTRDCGGKTEYQVMNQHHLHYSMLIEWSEEDQAYLVTMPE